MIRKAEEAQKVSKLIETNAYVKRRLLEISNENRISLGLNKPWYRFVYFTHLYFI